MIEQGLEPRASLHRRARLRMPGSDMTLEVDIEPVEAMRANFQALHRQRFGYVEEGAELVVDALVVEAVGILPGTGRGTANEDSMVAGLRPLRRSSPSDRGMAPR